MADKSRLQPSQSPIDSRLYDQQLGLQTRRYRIRGLREYEELLLGRDPESPIRAFIQEHTGASSLRELLQRTFERATDQDVWADMGGGQAIAMRQAKYSALVGRATLVNVDLFPYDAIPLDRDERERLRFEVGKWVFNRVYEPPLLQGEAQAVKIPGRARLITSVQMMQYLVPKLEGLVCWYNGLAVGGLMLVQSVGSFPQIMRDYGSSNQRLFERVRNTLAQHDIPSCYMEHRWNDELPDALGVLAVLRTSRRLNVVYNLGHIEHDREAQYVTTFYEGRGDPIMVTEG